MSSRFVLAAVVAAVALAGCARNHHSMQISSVASGDATIADDGRMVTPADEAPLPDDPIAGAEPTPVSDDAPPHWAPASQTVEAAPEAEESYLLDSGDKIRVFIYGQPNLSRVYPIDGSGFIAMPLIGAVKARATTTYDLAANIAELLQVSYVRDPEVSVEVASYRPFYILGEVRAAGQYPFVAGLTVEAAVAIAGGYGPRADKRGIEIVRVIDGVHTTIDAARAERVRPGDTVQVRERFF